MSSSLAIKKIDDKEIDKENLFEASNDLRPLIAKPIFQKMDSDEKQEEEMMEDS